MLQYTLLRDNVGDEWQDWFQSAGIDVHDSLHGPIFEHCDLSLRAAELGQGIALAYEALVADEIAAGTLVRLCTARTSPKVIYSITCPESWMRRRNISAFRRWLFSEMSELTCAAISTAATVDETGYVAAHPYTN